MFGGSKGVCPFGRRTLYGVREGEAESTRKQASVGRGKAKLFPLQSDSVKAKSSDVASSIPEYHLKLSDYGRVSF